MGGGGECYAPFFEYCESVRIIRVLKLCGTVSKTRAMACIMLARAVTSES